jgi:hypothetical protein
MISHPGGIRTGSHEDGRRVFQGRKGQITAEAQPKLRNRPDLQGSDLRNQAFEIQPLGFLLAARARAQLHATRSPQEARGRLTGGWHPPLERVIRSGVKSDPRSADD